MVAALIKSYDMHYFFNTDRVIVRDTNIIPKSYTWEINCDFEAGEGVQDDKLYVAVKNVIANFKLKLDKREMVTVEKMANELFEDISNELINSTLISLSVNSSPMVEYKITRSNI